MMEAEDERGVVSLNFTSWNQISECLRRLENIRGAA
jgi:conjugal transfer/entry exclusion protein